MLSAAVVNGFSRVKTSSLKDQFHILPPVYLFAGPPPSKKSRKQFQTDVDLSKPAMDRPSSVPSGAAVATSSLSEDAEDNADNSQITEADKKALPQDLEIPLRFKVS